MYLAVVHGMHNVSVSIIFDHFLFGSIIAKCMTVYDLYTETVNMCYGLFQSAPYFL